MNTIYKSKIIENIAFLAVFAFAVFASADARAGAGACTVNYNGKNIATECPDGRKARYDISPKCIENANANSCINTMPVTNVARIPEDVCFRGTGWSRKRNHNGMDYAAAMGTAVTAAMDGTITRFTFGTAEPARGVCQSTGGGYGNVIYIEHKGCDGTTYVTRYGHLTNKTVPGLKNGSKVKKGDVIGYVGGTGGACGRPHLHFELRTSSGALVNPMCNEIQGVCNCKTPVPSSGLESCKDASFAPSSSSPVSSAAGVTAISISGASTAETPKAATASCAPYEEVRNGYRSWGCIFCKPFEILFNTASVMAKQAYDALAKAVIIVVAVGMALWLAITILRYVSTMEIREPRMFVKVLVNQIFRVVFVIVLLNSGLTTILSYTVDPVFSTGLKVAQQAGKISDTCDLGDKISIVGSDKGGLSPAMGTGILCTIKSIQDQIVDILSLGRTCWCLAWSSENRVLFVFPNLAYLLTGFFFYAGGFLLLFIYPFLLVDCILKLSIAVALLPAALGAFAFKITSHYLQKIWEVFLNAIFSFIFLSIIIYIIASIAADTLSEIITSDVGIIIKIFWWMLEVVKVIAVCFLGWAVLGEMKKFADNFASGLKFEANGDIGAKTGSTAMEFGVKRPAMAVGKPVVKGAVKGGKIIGQTAAEIGHRATINLWKNAAAGNRTFNLFKPFSRVNGQLDEAKDADGNTMKDRDGNTMYDTTSAWQKLRGRKEYRSFSTDDTGNTRMNVTIERASGKRTETSTDSFATVTRQYDKHGTLVGNDSQINSVLLRNAMNSNGTCNQQVINNFMQNSLLSGEERQITVMRAIFNDRMNGVGDQLIDPRVQNDIQTGTDENGNTTWTVTQKFGDGSSTMFRVAFGGNNRVMSEYQTINAKGKGKAFATDGIVQRKTYIEQQTQADGSKITVRENRYAFTEYYSNSTAGRPLYSNGEFANNIPADQIMFSQKDIDNFANQVKTEGNKAYSFSEFRK